MAAAISVAVIEPVGGHGGMNQYDFSLCYALLAAGCHVSFYTCDETAPVEIPGLRFFPLYKHVYGQGGRWLRALRYIRGTIATLNEISHSRENICHLHIFGGEMNELMLILLSRLYNKKIVVTVHDVESFLSASGSRGKRLSAFYKLADRLIAHNAATKVELIERFCFPPNGISVIPHGNYIESLGAMPSSIEAKRALNIDRSRKVVLFFGHIKYVKGLDLLLEAIPKVVEQVSEAVFLIAGRPWKNDFSLYQRQIENLNIGDKCILHIRFIPDEELNRYYGAADVVVLPYRRIYQSGVVILAMSSGRPVVVSDLPGMTEIVKDGQTGYVFSRGSREDLTKQLIRSLQDDEGRKRIAEQGLEYIRTNHAWKRIGEMTTDVYRTVLSQ